MRAYIVAVLLFAAAACTKSIIIESTASWSAEVGSSTLAEAGGRTVAGAGNASVPVDGATVCWRIRKTSQTGTLRAYLRETSLLGADRLGDQMTTADFGLVEGCGQ
jgi:hypothetical protein